MKMTLLENAPEIREQFIKSFVMSWEEFQEKQKSWIAKMAERHPIDMKWYNNAYLWDKMDPKASPASFAEALTCLRSFSGPVLFMSEQNEDTHYDGEQIVNFVAQAEAHALAEQIEREWFNDYKLFLQHMYDPDSFLPQDLYVFDFSMKWCIVFTHETADWESELTDPIKAAASRYCIVIPGTEDVG